MTRECRDRAAPAHTKRRPSQGGRWAPLHLWWGSEPAPMPPACRTAPRGHAAPGEVRRPSMRSASWLPAPRAPRWRRSALDWPALARIACLSVQDGGRGRRRGGKWRGRVRRPRPVPSLRPRLSAGGPSRRWAALQSGHAWACCRGGAAGWREAGARSGEGTRGRERGGRARFERRRRRARAPRVVGAHAQDGPAACPCPRRGRCRGSHSRPRAEFPAVSSALTALAGSAGGTWGEGATSTASGQRDPGAGLRAEPRGCRRPRLGLEPAGVCAKEREAGREIVPTEPVPSLLKPGNLKQGNAIEVYKMRVVKGMFCICRIGGLGCERLWAVSTNLCTCQAGKI